jgi:hypothetical protein
VALYCEATVAEDLGELLPEISIREENAQAARSYTTACSTSSGRRS